MVEWQGVEVVQETLNRPELASLILVQVTMVYACDCAAFCAT